MNTSGRSYWRETIRNHPVIVASSAATAGVLLGGFFAMQLLDTSQPTASPSAQALAEAKPASAPVPETTGSAPTGESTASADCEQQTWPYLSRGCMDEYRGKRRAARVVSTDKLDPQTIKAVESPPPSSVASELAAPARWAPAVASTEPLTPASAQSAGVPPDRATPAISPAREVNPVASSQPNTTVASHAEDASHEPQSQPVAKTDTREKQAVKKAKRKPKSERRGPAKPDADDDSDDRAVAYADDGDDEPVAVGRRGRPRITERSTRRDYDVPDEDGGGRRRVIVIHRDRGGMLENLFGGF
jgi:hypothetical protein